MTRTNAVARTAAMILIGAMFASGMKAAFASEGVHAPIGQISVTEQLIARILN